MDDIFEPLLEQDPQPMVEWLEQQFRDNVLDGRPIAIADLYESALRVFCLYELRAVLPAGWTIQHELAPEGGWRRADLLLTGPGDFKILIELKYVQPGSVHYKGRRGHRWKKQLARGFRAVEDAEDILDLKIHQYRTKALIVVRDWIKATEFDVDPKFDAVKHIATREDHDADWSFVMVAVGAKFAILEIDDD